jgi:DNA invertase Pin-like site-specific DNA recombinase
VAKLDRLARSVHDFTGLGARSQKRGWALVVIDLQLDMMEPSGRLMANILASFAEFERDLIGKRTREALAVRRDQGVRLGRRRDLSNSLVDQMVAAREDGRTYQRIADQLNTEGIKTARGGSRWHPSTIRAPSMPKPAMSSGPDDRPVNDGEDPTEPGLVAELLNYRVTLSSRR